MAGAQAGSVMHPPPLLRRVARALVIVAFFARAGLGALVLTLTQRARGLTLEAASSAPRVTRLTFQRTLPVMSALSAAAALLLARGAQPPPAGPYDAIVVAGCRVLPNGQPSGALARRAALARDLFLEGRAPRVVFTGGVGRHGPSEASVAAAHAVSLGLPSDAVVLEERSTSTRENADYAARILGPNARVLVVTDAYHVFRARRVFAQAFAHAEAAGVPTREESLSNALPRELFAVLIYAARGDLRSRR